jgi:hypothetical protein
MVIPSVLSASRGFRPTSVRDRALEEYASTFYAIRWAVVFLSFVDQHDYRGRRSQYRCVQVDALLQS